jgi:hypothetical protein
VKALVFAPHAGIWEHAFPEALIAEALRASDIDVVYVTCGGGFSSICVAMGARGVTHSSSRADKDAVCRDCQKNRDFLRTGFALAGYDFDSVLTADDERWIEARIREAKPATIAAFEVDGMRVGRAALYEYLIQKKKSQLDLSDNDWLEFRPRLINALRSLVAAGKILDREKPDRVLAYNTLYSVNAMWRAAATKRGIPSYFLHAGVSLNNRLQQMIVGRDSTLLWYTHLLEQWPAFRDVPCTADELAAVTDHFEQLFRGTSVFAYSAAKSTRSEDLRARFGVKPEQKMLVASMSSYDEYVAAAAIGEMPVAHSALFPTQIEWVRALSEHLRGRPDLSLIIRVHPREFPNKREGAKSEHAMLLERELAALPANVKVNWPDDKLSIYDLAEHADVFLNAWSSAGREMTLLGIPVVVYAPELLLYPSDLNYVGTSRESYFGAIDTALRDGWSFERMRMTYRWCALELVRSVVDISDGFDFSEDPPQLLWQRAVKFALTRPGVRQRWDLARKPKRLRAQQRLGELIHSGRATLVEPPRTAASQTAETAALRAQITRLLRALYGETNATPVPGTLRHRLTTAL